MANVGLRIPDSQKKTFIAIADVDSNQLEPPISALRKLRPSTHLSSSAHFLSEKTGFEASDAARLLMAVSSLFTLQERLGLTSDDLRQELLEAIEADEELMIDGE